MILSVIKNTLGLLVLFSFSLCFGQKHIDPLKKQKFDSALTSYQLDMSKTDSLGKILLKNAQTDYEKSIGYNVLGENEIDNSNYVKSVDYLEKSISHIKKTDSIQVYLRILGTIIVAYRQAGLINESDSNWNLFQKEVNKFPEKDRAFYLLFIRARMFDIDKNYCKSAETRSEFYHLTKNIYDNTDKANPFNFAILVQIVYDEFKCGNIEASRKAMIDVESVLDKMKQRNNIFMYEFYLLDKALFHVKDNEVEEAKIAFDEAYKLSRNATSNSIKKVILEERLNANIDSAEEKIKMYEELETLINKEIKATKSITEVETIKNKKELEKAKKNKQFYFIIFGGVSLVLLSIIAFSYFRTKKQKAQYIKIIKELEGSGVDKSVQDDYHSSEKLIKNDKTAQDILKNLRAFEQKKLFNTKGISAAQMAVMLKTNTKYLTYILKEYRNSDFYNYINLQRINFIVRELHEKPALLNYKISVLSDMCGYASHSQFTSIFKNIKEISPSQYINFLKRDIERKNKL